MFWAKIAAVVAAALVVTPVRADDAPETGVQLAQGNFADKTAKGLW